jgi:hypothetical protein
LETGALAIRATGLHTKSRNNLRPCSLPLKLLSFAVSGVLLTEAAVFFKLKPLGFGFFIFGSRIITALAV